MSTRDYYYARRACPRCNRVYMAGVRTQAEEVCPACKKELARIDRESLPRGYKGSVPQWWIIVKSPDPDWQPGVKFQTLDFATSLSAGVWPAGMVVECAQCRYTVQDTRLIDEQGQVKYLHAGQGRGK